MWETVAATLLIHIGKKAVDTFWFNRDSSKKPVVDQTGNITYTGLDTTGRTVIPTNFTKLRHQQSATIFGNLYLPDTIQDIIVGDEIVLVLVIGEDNERSFLFEADIERGYRIDLPYGYYSIFIFIVDSEEEGLFDAAIDAIGFPTAEGVDLSGIREIFSDNYEDFWGLVDSSPIKVTRGGSFYLDFIFFDTIEADLPQSFSEIFENEARVFGYICSNCGTQVTSIIDICGATITEIRCNFCGNESFVNYICPNCFRHLGSLRCYRCQRIISVLICPGCRSSIPL